MSLSKYLAKYLQKLNELEKAQESLRQNLGSHSYFQVLTVFERIDKYKNGNFTPSDLS